MTKNSSAIKAGQYYAVRCNGNNGDLIVGRVVSVRASGHVVLHNLLSGKTSTKKESVLRQRNKRVTKAQALEIQEVYLRTGSKAQTRVRAVEMVAYGSLPPESRAKDIHTRMAEKMGAVRKRMNPARKSMVGIEKAIEEYIAEFMKDVESRVLSLLAASIGELDRLR